MKLLIKIGLVIVVIILIGIGIQFFSVTKGLNEGKNIVINEVDLSKIDDGIYTGEYEFERWSNKVLVEVSDNRIAKIEITEPVTYEDPAETKELVERVLEKQNTNVDAVSGATVTSKAYLKSIENALSLD